MRRALGLYLFVLLAALPAALFTVPLFTASGARAEVVASGYALTKLNVIDLDKSLDFYKRGLGLHEVRRVDLGAQAEIMLTMGGGEYEYMLVLVHQKQPKEPLTMGAKFNSIGFVLPDVPAAAKRLTDAGYPLMRPVETLTQSPLPYAKSIVLTYAKDPDGVIVELIQFNK
jgi:lactoylglutathione lyase